MDWNLKNIVLVDLAIVLVCLSVSYFLGSDIKHNAKAGGGIVDTAYGYSIMTIAVGLVTFFGLLDLPGGKGHDGNFNPDRIRFCITATLFVLFLVYFGTTAYWNNDETLADFPRVMTQNLTSLLMVVIPFYFGATAAIEIFSKRREEGVPAVEKSEKQP